VKNKQETHNTLERLGMQHLPRVCEGLNFIPSTKKTKTLEEK
jgi:hypothetical protein